MSASETHDDAMRRLDALMASINVEREAVRKAANAALWALKELLPDVRADHSDAILCNCRRCRVREAIRGLEENS